MTWAELLRTAERDAPWTAPIVRALRRTADVPPDCHWRVLAALTISWAVAQTDDSLARQREGLDVLEAWAQEMMR